MAECHSVAGGWLGTYYYRLAFLEPTRFEACFTAGAEGKFTGTILDDGHLGEAGVSGEQIGDVVRFVKQYLRPPKGMGASPVDYEGTISEDGQTIKGKWCIDAGKGAIPRRTRGTWTAHRMWSHSEEEQPEAEPSREAIGRELVAV